MKVYVRGDLLRPPELRRLTNAWVTLLDADIVRVRKHFLSL